MKIEGVIKDVIFSDNEDIFIIASFQLINGDIVNIKGDLGGFEKDTLLSLEVTEEINNYGKQYIVNKIYILSPYNSDIFPFFLKYNFKNIGDIKSLRIYNFFGDKLLEILDKNPHEINKVPKIDTLAKKSIINNWEKVRNNNKIINDFILTMYDIGLNNKQLSRFIKIMDHVDYNDILKNPYILLKYTDINFKLVDNFALRIGVDKNNEERVKHGIEYYSIELIEQGDCYIEFDLFYVNLSNALSISIESVLKGIDSAVNEKIIYIYNICDKDIVMPREYNNKEKNIVNKIENINSNFLCKYLEKDIQNIINGIKVEGINEFNIMQKKAILNTIMKPISIITGGPGTGKTTVLKGILKTKKIIDNKEKICLLAPTGKAAKRIEDSTGVEAKTIHRELFSLSSSDKLDYDTIIIDEASMIDLTIMDWLFSKIKSNSKIIIIGDHDQLEPIKEGKVFEDLIKSNTISVTTLNKGYRYENNLIHKNAFNVNSGISLELPRAGDKDSDFYYIKTESDNKTSKMLVDIYCNQLKKRKNINPIIDVQILTPMKKGKLGVTQINKDIQKQINPRSSFKKEIKILDNIFREGDKVIQIENNYNKVIFNGDIGFINKISKKTVSIVFNGKIVEYEKNELNQIQLAYAITIHKSQGSEFRYVIMPMSIQHFSMLKRKLFYTGITRAKEMLITMGSIEAINIAIENRNYKERKTIMEKRLKKEI